MHTHFGIMNVFQSYLEHLVKEAKLPDVLLVQFVVLIKSLLKMELLLIKLKAIQEDSQ